MDKRDWALPPLMKKENRRKKLVVKSFYIQEEIEKKLGSLSGITGIEKSLLVNEAIGDLVRKYQPLTAIDLLEKILIQ